MLAQQIERLVQEVGKQALLIPSDVGDADHCQALVAKAVDQWGYIDILGRILINASDELGKVIQGSARSLVDGALRPHGV
ncbi:MAG: SDR family oxidoreductase [Pseudomonadota bacterium]